MAPLPPLATPLDVGPIYIERDVFGLNPQHWEDSVHTGDAIQGITYTRNVVRTPILLLPPCIIYFILHDSSEDPCSTY